jgi:predicted GNAT family N-acyltransferase
VTSLMVDFDPKPHYFFEIEKNNFIIKIANSYEEIRLAQKLRHKVFSEVSAGFTGEIDSDDYDYSADHLIIIDKATNNVVGTYRFLLSDKVNRHYSEREFDLTEFLKLPGRKMELGRASVDPSARAGVIITLLWRGIAEYLKITKSDYLFGCSSIWGVGSDEIMTLCQSLQSKNLVSKIQTPPLQSHWPLGLPNNIHDFNLSYESNQNMISEFKMNIIYDQYVPTLVKTYIHVGAQFSVPPAYDKKLNTFEFFGFVETKNINQAFKKKYL